MVAADARVVIGGGCTLLKLAAHEFRITRNQRSKGGESGKQQQMQAHGQLAAACERTRCVTSSTKPATDSRH